MKGTMEFVRMYKAPFGVDLSLEQSLYPFLRSRHFFSFSKILKIFRILSKEKASAMKLRWLCSFASITKWSWRESNPRPNKEA